MQTGNMQQAASNKLCLNYGHDWRNFLLKKEPTMTRFLNIFRRPQLFTQCCTLVLVACNLKNILQQTSKELQLFHHIPLGIIHLLRTQVEGTGGLPKDRKSVV